LNFSILWTDKISDMEDDKILNEEHLPEVEKTKGDKSAGDKEGIIQIHKPFRILRTILFIFISLLSALFLLIFILYFVPVLQEKISGKKNEITNNKDLKQDATYKKQIGLLTKDIQRLSRKYTVYTPGQTYIVINTTDNRFYLYKNKELIREGSCSTGSYKKLQTEGGKSWTFKTPRGKFWIQAKRTHPAWHRPDWSFIEEGVPIPPKDSPLRWEAGVLGDYAMDLGDSYMIHGTIYKRFLGMPVTHGCVRLNDEDLEVVYNTVSVGSKVYIF
jgi:lipoprotein-anchoring transpeptidase ErfK/SrfK